MGSPLRSGKLDQSLVVTVPSRTRTATGGQTLDYDLNPAAVLTVRALKLPDRRQDENQEGREVVRALSRFDVLYDTRLWEADDARFEWRGRVFDIMAIDDPDGERRRLRITAERNQDREERQRP